MMPSFNLSEAINIQDVHKAPSSFGLYVWYARFNVGMADWHSDYSGGDDIARSSLLRALQEHSMKFGQQEMSIQALANFSTIWKGILEEDTSTKWRKCFKEDSSDVDLKVLSTVIAQNNSREALVKIIDRSFPLFNSPLYLGLALDQSLRERLEDHRRIYLGLWERYSKDRDIIRRIDKPKNFAERAIKLGFGPEDLFCYTLAVSRLNDDTFTTDELYALVALTEWILNRWSTPILGRQ